MYLGQDPANNKAPIGYPGDGHILTVGPTRCGKSRRVLIPNLLMETARSMLVVDVKGEISAMTAPHRAAKGSRVVLIDPYNVSAARGLNAQRVGFNPLSMLDPASPDFVDDSMLVAESMVQVEAGSKDPHWAESAQDVAAALIMWVVWQLGDAATLDVVRHYLCQPAESLKKISLQAEMENAPSAIAAKLAKFKGKLSDELSSILSTAQTQTRFLDSPPIQHSLAQSDFNFSCLKNSNTTVYLILPPERLNTHAKWLRLVIGSAMREMQRTLKTPGRPDVLFVLDEFPALGKLASIETAVSLNAGFGVKVWAYVQNFPQLKELYGDNWETFLSAGCIQAFAPRDVFTRDHLTRLIGPGSKVIRSISHGHDGHSSVTDAVQKDDLMTPDDWRRMKLGDQVAFIPTHSGQIIKRLASCDCTELPEVVAGKILLPAS